MEGIEYLATGRRKSATARVYLRPGKGTFRINGRSFEEYFPNDALKLLIRQPLLITGTAEKFDILINVKGGGATGQAGAIRHGMARALVGYDKELHKALRKAGLLTRDSRIKERKKYGQKGARARFQFSKR